MEFEGYHCKMPRDLLADPGISPAAKLVFCRLLDLTRASGDDQAWPSQQRLADDLGMHRSQVRRAIADLIAAVMIEVRSGEGRSASVFTIKSLLPRSGPKIGQQSDQTPKSCGPIIGQLVGLKQANKGAVVGLKQAKRENIEEEHKREHSDVKKIQQEKKEEPTLPEGIVRIGDIAARYRQAAER